MPFLNHIIITLAVVLIASVQIIVKARLTSIHGNVPSEMASIIPFATGALRDPWLWLAGICVLFSAYFWYFAVSRLSLGVAFSFAALSYPIVMIGSQIFLGERFTLLQFTGCSLIVAGIFLIAVNA